MASILCSFDIFKPVDEKGTPIEPSGEYTTGLVSYPLPFKCGFKPRSDGAERLIRSALLDAD